MSADASERRAYLVRGGIASLAAAAFLVRDGAILGQNITILEESASMGGSLDGSGAPETLRKLPRRRRRRQSRGSHPRARRPTLRVPHDPT